MRKIEIEIPEGKNPEWVNDVLTLVDEPKKYYEFEVGDKAILKNDTAFKQGDGVCLISAGAEVEIMSVSNCINDIDKLYEVKYQNTATVVKGGDIEPKPVEYKFNVGDKASLNRAVCFIQVSGDYDLVNAGTEVEIVKVLDSADASEKKYRIKHHYSTAVVFGRDLDKIEFKFNLGDKVIYSLFGKNKAMTITERSFDNGCPFYNLKSYNIYTQAKEEDIQPYVQKDITERIKTFYDACEWCYENNYTRLVSGYFTITNSCEKNGGLPNDVLAYLKLRIITCALNEGWEPTCETYSRYVPYYCNGRHGGLELASSYSGDSSSKLCFKNEDLAKYAANQFRDIYDDYCGYKGVEK